MECMHFSDPLIQPGTHHPFTAEDATQMGISRRRLYGPEFRTVLRGVFIDRRIPDSLPVRTRAALLVAPPGGVASHLTAACLWTANAERTGHIHLSYRGTRHCMRDEIKVHRFTYPLDTSARHGLLLTSPGMTFMHLAVVQDLVKLTAFGDMLVKRQVITADELLSYAAAWSHHGARAGRLAASYVRDRVDSVPESNLRLLMVLAGLPQPEINPWVLDENGERKYRLDLAYTAFRLAIEYDGRWHDDPEQVLRDQQRRAWLRARGWTVLVIKAADLYENSTATVQALREQLILHAVPVGPARYDYQRYFGTVLSTEDDPFWGPRIGADRASAFPLAQ